MLVVNTIGGLSPMWWHFSSMLLYSLTTLLVYRLCEKLLESRVAAFFAALLFAVHPIHVDAVSWVSASNEILFTLLALGAIIVLLAPDGSVPLTPSRLAASPALYAAALLTKETAVALLPVLLLIVLFRSGQRGKVVRASYWCGFVT